MVERGIIMMEFTKRVCYKIKSFMSAIEYRLVSYLTNAVECAPHSTLALMWMEDIALIFAVIMALKTSTKNSRKKIFGGLGIIYIVCGIISAIAFKFEIPRNLKYEEAGIKGWDDLE